MPTSDPTVVWHPGAHKTGTTVFQKFLDRNTALLAEHGVQRVPRKKLSDAIGWGDPVRADPGVLTNLVAEYSIPGTRFLVGSMENMLGRPFLLDQPGLYPNAEKNIEALAGATDALRTKVVLSIRPQAEFLESYYLQSIHEGGYLSFEAWCAAIDLESVSWDPVIEALTRRLGQDNVAVVDFRRIRDGQPAFVGDMLAAVDPSLRLPVEFSEVHNRSLSAHGLQIALAVNPLLNNWPERRVMRRFLQANFSNLTGERPTLLSDEQRAALTARFAGEYEAALARYGVSADSPAAAPDLKSAGPDQDPGVDQNAEPDQGSDTRRMRRLSLRRR
ncbi:MAG: hypothetical protein ACT4PP_15110 [Sporichthyaceae bacterium]